MTVKVRLFAAARETAGSEELEIELPDGATFSDLRKKLVFDRPRMAAVCGRALFASDACYVDDEEIVSAGDEIALIPPVSGG